MEISGHIDTHTSRTQALSTDHERPRSNNHLHVISWTSSSYHSKGLFLVFFNFKPFGWIQINILDPDGLTHPLSWYSRQGEETLGCRGWGGGVGGKQCQSHDPSFHIPPQSFVFHRLLHQFYSLVSNFLFQLFLSFSLWRFHSRHQVDVSEPDAVICPDLISLTQVYLWQVLLFIHMLLLHYLL